MNTSSFTAIKLCLVVIALATAACGSAATPTASAPVDDYYGEPNTAAHHDMEVTFVVSPEVARASYEEKVEAHQPAATIGMNDVTDAQNHSLTALR